MRTRTVARAWMCEHGEEEIFFYANIQLQTEGATLRRVKGGGGGLFPSHSFREAHIRDMHIPHREYYWI